jgi:hypothetical protein
MEKYMQPSVFRQYLGISVALVFALLALASCVTSRYDATADAKLTALQQDVDTQMVLMASLSTRSDANSIKLRSYDANIDFYNKTDVDLTSLELRMEAISGPGSDNTQKIFESLRATLSSIANTHKKQGSASREYWIANRSLLNIEFGALIRRELVYKGLTTASANGKKAGAANESMVKSIV